MSYLRHSSRAVGSGLKGLSGHRSPPPLTHPPPPPPTTPVSPTPHLSLRPTLRDIIAETRDEGSRDPCGPSNTLGHRNLYGPIIDLFLIMLLFYYEPYLCRLLIVCLGPGGRGTFLGPNRGRLPKSLSDGHDYSSVPDGRLFCRRSPLDRPFRVERPPAQPSPFSTVLRSPVVSGPGLDSLMVVPMDRRWVPERGRGRSGRRVVGRSSSEGSNL